MAIKWFLKLSIKHKILSSSILFLFLILKIKPINNLYTLKFFVSLKSTLYQCF